MHCNFNLNFKSRSLLCAASLVLAQMAAPLAAAADRPTPIPIYTPSSLKADCDRGLASLKQQVRALERRPISRDAAALFRAMNRLDLSQESFGGPVYLQGSVSPDKAVREAAEPCIVAMSNFATELRQNAKIYARIKAVQPRDAIDRKMQRDLLDAFEDTGVALPSAQRARLLAINDEMEKLNQQYDKNVRDNTERVRMSEAEMKGLPASYLERAKKNAQGEYELSFEYPEYRPFMAYAENEAARRRYQFAFYNRGTPENLALLQKIVTLRAEVAQIFGLKSFADYMIRRRMAKTPEAVFQFLGEVRQAVFEGEKRDLEELRSLKAQTLGTPLAQTTLARWDLEYWQNKLKQQRYRIDQEGLRAYFPSQPTVNWALDISGQLYGLRFAKREVPVWHEEVQYYDVIDQASGRVISGIYLDLYPREGKYNHAAAFPVYGSSTLTGNMPVSTLVTNFNRQGFNAEEIETLMHEFGHVLHGVLSRTRYAAQSGTSVERDFVEAPSQMYEEWAKRLSSLEQIKAKHCSACPALTPELVQQLRDAERFGKGIHYGRQLLYAGYDMRLHSERQADTMALWREMEGATPLGYTAGTQFPGQFGHVAGGYAAGYYGYMWSEVLALDLLSAYGKNIINPEQGMKLRKAILERGSEQGGMDMVRQFLGREPNAKAFFAEITGKRD